MLAWPLEVVRKSLLDAEQKVVNVYLPNNEVQTLDLGSNFNRCHRLLNASDFQKVFDTPDIRFSEKKFLILIRRTESKKPRLGMVIPKKKVRFAVNRNRCKRIIRESFRTHKRLLEGLELIVFARDGLDKLSRKDLHEQLQHQWWRVWRKQQKLQQA